MNMVKMWCLLFGLGVVHSASIALDKAVLGILMNQPQDGAADPKLLIAACQTMAYAEGIIGKSQDLAEANKALTVVFKDRALDGACKYPTELNPIQTEELPKGTVLSKEVLGKILNGFRAAEKAKSAGGGAAPKDPRLADLEKFEKTLQAVVGTKKDKTMAAKEVFTALFSATSGPIEGAEIAGNIPNTGYQLLDKLGKKEAALKIAASVK